MNEFLLLFGYCVGVDEFCEEHWMLNDENTSHETWNDPHQKNLPEPQASAECHLAPHPLKQQTDTNLIIRIHKIILTFYL